MSIYDEEVVGTKKCKWGCEMDIQIRKRHLHPSHSVPDFIPGHQQFGNKKGWKNGFVKNVNGYVLVYSPNHPNKNAQGKGYVLRSRLIMEQRIGRYLTPEEVIHHVNGIRDDDRPENLYLTTNSEHLSMHHKISVANQIRDELGRFAKGGDANVQ